LELVAVESSHFRRTSMTCFRSYNAARRSCSTSCTRSSTRKLPIVCYLRLWTIVIELSSQVHPRTWR
jgi:hypothetical protein